MVLQKIGFPWIIKRDENNPKKCLGDIQLHLGLVEGNISPRRGFCLLSFGAQEELF